MSDSTGIWVELANLKCKMLSEFYQLDSPKCIVVFNTVTFEIQIILDMPKRLMEPFSVNQTYLIFWSHMCLMDCNFCRYLQKIMYAALLKRKEPVITGDTSLSLFCVVYFVYAFCSSLHCFVHQLLHIVIQD